MKKLYIILGSLALITACDNDLDQIPPKQLESGNLSEFNSVLNAAYYYQTGAATPFAVMGDFRADNMEMFEAPYPAFDRFDSDLAGGDLVEQFFRPFYSNLYKSILSANSVIENSTDATEIAEARFLRGLSYFKLVMVFGDVSVILTPQPNIEEIPIVDFSRQPADQVYDNVIIPDLQSAIGTLDNSGLANARATQIAAKAFLAKVYMHRSNFGAAETELEAVIRDAAAEGIILENDFANVVSDGNSEILFVTQFSTSIPDAYEVSPTEFPAWFGGGDSKSPTPLDADLITAFDASAAAGGGLDLRKALSIDEESGKGVKYTGALEQDFIELRLSDVILMYAEALNENGTDADTVLSLLDDIRSRAGLNSLSGTVSSQANVRQAIQDERRLELAFEGHRWFDLVRTGTVDAEMGQTINSNYYVFPIPSSEILASDGVITQNEGY